jgi:hypothetical protein
MLLVGTIAFAVLAFAYVKVRRARKNPGGASASA